MKYEKADAEVIYFTNRDVIATSGGEGGGGSGTGTCRVPGHNRGNGCTETSGMCPDNAWQ